MGKDADIDLRLRWRPTWPDRDHDFACSVPERRGSVGRIYLYGQAPAAGHWYWSYQAHVPGVERSADSTGMAPSPREAAKAVEDRWFVDLAKASKAII